MTTYPSVADYRCAVQHPEQVFTTTGLQRAAFANHPVLGVPIPATGRTAAVFQAEVDGQTQALRFFTRNDGSTRHRYDALATHLSHGTLGAHIAHATWQDRAIRIREHRWPLVSLEWIEGRTLDRYVEHLVNDGDRGALSALAAAWRELIASMQRDRLAHGDLQHGNVLVDQQGRLRLVDLDAVWIDELAGLPAPAESGHPNYQRRDAGWGRRIDTFPALVIYLSLRALAHDPEPWHTLHNDDNLIFTEEDFAEPFATPAWKHLTAMHDPALDALADQLSIACRPSWSAVDDLEDLLARAGQHPAHTDDPWWIQAAAQTQSQHEAVKTPRTDVAGQPLPPPPPKDPTPPTNPSPPYRPEAPTNPSWWSQPQHAPENQWWAPQTNPEPPTGQTPEPQRPPDRRYATSFCVAATVALIVGYVVYDHLTGALGGERAVQSFLAFAVVDVLTFLLSLAVFEIRNSPPGP